MMDAVSEHHDPVACLDFLAVDLVRLRCGSHQPPDRRIKTHGLLDHRARVGQRGVVRSRRFTIPVDRLSFSANSCSRLRVFRGFIHRPCERQSRGLGPSPQILLQLINCLRLIELRDIGIGNGIFDHLEQRALAHLAGIGSHHLRWDTSPNVHRLGGILLRNLELFSRHLLHAYRLVVHHIGVGFHTSEYEVGIERHVAIEQRFADHICRERPRLLDHLEFFT